MTSEANCMSAFWPSGRQSLQSVAKKTYEYLNRLRIISNSFLYWYCPRQSLRATTGKKFDYSSCKSVYEGMKQQSNLAGWPSLCINNGNEDLPDDIRLDISVGMPANQNIDNCISLTWSDSRSLRSFEMIVDIIHATVSVWNPRYIEVHDGFVPQSPEDYFVGEHADVPDVQWIVHLTQREIFCEDVPSAFKVIYHETLGSTVIVTKMPFCRTNPSHVDAANSVQSELKLKSRYFLFPDPDYRLRHD